MFGERALKKFREHVSRVFQVRHEVDEIALKVLKSIDFKEYGEEITIPVG